jgi:uncharacterized protein YggE
VNAGKTALHFLLSFIPFPMADTFSPKSPVWLPIVVVLIGGCFYLYGKQMEIRVPVDSPFVISVSADAKVSTPPDVATLSFGVSTGRQSTAKGATDILAKTMAKVIDATKKAGIEEKDIMTESFYLSPEYDYTTGGQVPRGFQATQSLRVKVRDLDKVSDVLGAATAAGANQAGGVVFGIDEMDTVKAKARAMAIEKAKVKAQALASELGMSLGRMTGFSEDGGYGGMPMPMMAKANYDMGGAMEAVQNVQIPAGEQEVRSSVVLNFELR